jgi:GMP synthase-like glutamine amidotransferase
MRVHVLQHVPFEDIGSISTWLVARDAEVEYTRFYESASSLPPSEKLDLVIAMGGPMSVNDESTSPWLRIEKRFIREVIERGVPIVGICLGAQLIAGSLGARVRACREKEIGWFEIEAVETGGSVSGSDPVFRFPERAEVFHWHGEAFDLPDGAVLLARSAACANQAFQIGSAIGLQFHLETTPESLGLLIDNCRDELIDGPFIQTEDAMLSAPFEAFININRHMDEVLSHITDS